LQIIQSILAGQGGRLFLELRDKASLAYTVAPLRMEGIDAGYFGAYIGCSPEKGEKAISMMKIEFEKLMNEAVSADELERSKKYLIGRHDIDLQKTSSVSAAILFDSIYGLPADEAFQFPDKIQAVNPEGVQDLAQKIFSQHAVVSAVGPQKPW
ncbi:MAG: insulinase family protein, partial [Pseudomonadota bacterium]